MTSRAKTATTAITKPPIHQRSSCCRRPTEIPNPEVAVSRGSRFFIAKSMSTRIAGLAGRWAIEIGSSGGRFVDDEWGEDRVKKRRRPFFPGRRSLWVVGRLPSPSSPERGAPAQCENFVGALHSAFFAWQPIGSISLFPGFRFRRAGALRKGRPRSGWPVFESTIDVGWGLRDISTFINANFPMNKVV